MQYDLRATIIFFQASLHWIELEKGPNGLGFSILDKHDETGHFVKIRGLVAGGAAEQQGELKDRIQILKKIMGLLFRIEFLFSVIHFSQISTL